MQTEYQQRRQDLMAKIGSSTAIFRSAPTAVMHNDVEYIYRQDSDFFYLTGFNEAQAVADRIYYHLGRDRNFNDKIIQHYQSLLRTYPKRGTGPIAIADPSLVLHDMRLYKSTRELDLMRQAVEIAVEAHNYALQSSKPGRYEYEIQAEIEHLFRLRGGMGPAYPSIVAAGKNACVLHYIENNSQLQEQDLLLIDAGCAYGYYNSDITRTFPVSGKFTPEQKALYEVVLAAQKQAIAEVKPGNSFYAPHNAAVRILTEGLVELGLLKGEIDKLIEEEKYKPFYMHRTSHWLGLDVHDVGIYQHGENPQILQPGQVLTIEPGLYIVPHTKPAEDQPEIDPRWLGIGIRIEDDVLVTSEGNEVLTAGVPKEIKDLER